MTDFINTNSSNMDKPAPALHVESIDALPFIPDQLRYHFVWAIGAIGSRQTSSSTIDSVVAPKTEPLPIRWLTRNDV